MIAHSLAVSPLPGSNLSTSSLRRYLVIFEADAVAPKGRAEVYAFGTASTQSKLDRMREFIERHGLLGELARIDPPTAFGAVGITATPRIAELLHAAPQVKAVIAD